MDINDFPRLSADSLEKLTISIEDLQTAGGNETAIPKKFDDILYPLGWREIRITGDLLVGSPLRSDGVLRCSLWQSQAPSSPPPGTAEGQTPTFGFKHGLPLESDLVFDVRFLPNPFYIDSLRSKTGLEEKVRDYVFSFRETGQFMEYWVESIMASA